MTEQQREEWQSVCHHLADNGLEIGKRAQVTLLVSTEPCVLLGHVYRDGWMSVVQLETVPKGVLTLAHYSRVTPA